MQYCPRILNARIAAPLRTPEGLVDDPVMGLDHGIGDSAAPFHGTDGTDGETAITRNVAQPVGEVALPLAAKTGNAMRRNGLQQIGGKIEALQEFQAIENSRRSRRPLMSAEFRPTSNRRNQTNRLTPLGLGLSGCAWVRLPDVD